MILISMGQHFALLLVVHNFLISILPLLLGIISGGHVARMGEGKGVYRVLVGKPERKHHL